MVSPTVIKLWRATYVSDYLGFALLLTAYVSVNIFVYPFHRMFSLDNLAIQYPHAVHERVPVAWLFGIAAGVPLAVLILWALIARPTFHKAHVTVLGLFISIVLTTFLTDIVKNSVGRPRPDLIARCKPKPGTPAHKLVTYQICTETNPHVLHDGWRSFPSGHSSFSFSGLGYLSLFLCGQFSTFRPRTDLATVLISLAPLLVAALIAISRLEDYRHDVYDVTAGSILGLLIAVFTYRRYYPALSSRNCNEPYPSRAEMEKGFTKVRDEEERLGAAREFEIGDDEEGFGESIPLTTTSR